MSSNAQALIIRILLAVVVLFDTTEYAAAAATLEQETATKIEQIRSIRPGQSDAIVSTYNREMNAAWQFFSAHLPGILPVLRSQLKAEVARAQPSDLVLLDVGFLFKKTTVPRAKLWAREALFRLNPQAAIISENHMEFFEMTHAAAMDHDPRVLSLIDGNFLTSDEKISIPQHALQLDGTLVCVYLYGAYGPEAEAHLASKLPGDSLATRILEVLIWLGSPASLQQVGSVLSASPNYETLSRVTAFMMQVAGPGGRDYMLKLDPGRLDGQSREYLAKVHAAIQNVSFDTIRTSLSQLPGDKQLPDAEVKSRINAMMSNYGKDESHQSRRIPKFRAWLRLSHSIVTQGTIACVLSSFRRSAQRRGGYQQPD